MGTAVEVAELRQEVAGELAVLELRGRLRAGRRYVLQLGFEGRLEEDLDGLFLTRYTDQGRSSMLIASQLEPTYARTVYPCFDEPAMKATFNIRIVHDPSYVALSNMPAIDVSEMADENGSLWTVTTFNTSLKMSTYLTAFVVCDFDYVTRTERGNEDKIFYDHVVQPVLREDNEIGVRSLSESEDKIKDSFALMSLFDSITYNKGASITWMLSCFLSEKLFIRALTVEEASGGRPLMWSVREVFPEMQVSESEYDWILLNVNLSGYYRVNYDQLNLKRLARLLENDPKAIPAVSRIQLIDDAFALTQFGYIEIETALELTKYLAKEDELFIWNMVLSNLVPKNLESTLKNYELVYLEKLFGTACWLGLQDCLNLSSELYAKWMDNPDYKYGKELLYEVLKVMGRFVNTDVQIQELQVFYNATLEEDERVVTTLLLEFTKVENMGRRELFIKAANWLQKNVDD
ncbi:hypothetical protein Q9233_016329 [Columba guinea]|nr:hypothetical protein Q9233_016329 [Columba guinea]